MTSLTGPAVSGPPQASVPPTRVQCSSTSRWATTLPSADYALMVTVCGDRIIRLTFHVRSSTRATVKGL